MRIFVNGYPPKALAWLVFISVAGLALLFAPLSIKRQAPPTDKLTTISPSGRYEVRLHELPSWIDRNFELRVLDRATGAEKQLFQSPDEGRPIGTERFLWSNNGRYLLLLGREFFTVSKATLSNGEKLYLLWDSATNKVWCNARQLNTLDRFSLADVARLGFENELKAKSESK